MQLLITYLEQLIEKSALEHVSCNAWAINLQLTAINIFP